MSNTMQEITKLLGGCVYDEFECVHNNFGGSLFCGPEGFYFQGKILFLEWSISIRWQDIVQLIKTKHNNIRVTVKKGSTYEFEKLVDPNRAWKTLRDLHSGQSKQKNGINHDSLNSIISNTNHTNKSIHDSFFSMEDTVEMTVEDAWSKSMEQDELLYSEIAVQNIDLPCDLSMFMDLFVVDDAKHSIPNFMSENGEVDVKAFPWTPSSVNDHHNQSSACRSHSRIVEYTHPVNAPMAPPLAKARKEQSYTKYGDYGVVLDTKTIVEDVPMTDCFFVAERIRVEQVGGGEEEEKNKENCGCRLSILFDIRFIKVNMFKAIIAKTTKSEIDKAMNDLATYISNKLSPGTKVIKSESVEMAKKTTTATSSTSTSSTSNQVMLTPSILFLGLLLLLSILFVQLWLVWSMHEMKRDMDAIRMRCASVNRMIIQPSISEI